MKRTLFDIINQKIEELAEPFENEARKPSLSRSNSLLQQRFTNEIINNGDLTVLKRFIGRYKKGQHEDLLGLFEGNILLARWIFENAPLELIISLPKEVRDMIDELLSSSG